MTMLPSTEAPACGNEATVFHVCRQTGRAVFKQALLAKHGKLVIVPQRQLSSHSIDGLAFLFMGSNICPLLDPGCVKALLCCRQ